MTVDLEATYPCQQRRQACCHGCRCQSPFWARTSSPLLRHCRRPPPRGGAVVQSTRLLLGPTPMLDGS